MEFYDENNYQQFARYANTPRNIYLYHLLQHGAQSILSDVSPGQIYFAVIVIDDSIIPISISNERITKSWITSHYTFYVDYLHDELKKSEPGWKVLLIGGFLQTLGFLCRIGKFNQVVYINQWFFTTPYELRLSAAQIKQISNFLRDKYPQHALVFREVYREIMWPWQIAGYTAMVHRPVLIWDKNYKFSRNNRYCINRTIRAARHVDVEIAQQGFSEQVHSQYTSLYIKKYSHYNPHYTPLFFAIAPTQLTLLRDKENNEIIGFSTHYEEPSQIVGSLCGYEVGRSRDFSPYEIIIGILLQLSRTLDKPFFMSTGVASFKKLRGAKDRMMYEMINITHLPWWRRLPWNCMRVFLNFLAANMNLDGI